MRAILVQADQNTSLLWTISEMAVTAKTLDKTKNLWSGCDVGRPGWYAGKNSGQGQGTWVTDPTPSSTTCVASGESFHTLSFCFIPDRNNSNLCNNLGRGMNVIIYHPNTGAPLEHPQKDQFFMSLPSHTASFPSLQHKWRKCSNFPLNELWRISNYESLNKHT